MVRSPNELTPREAADILGIHPRTLIAWIKEAVAGNSAQLTTVRVDGARKVPRYYVDASEVRELARRSPKDYF